MDFETIKNEFIKQLEKELIKKKASYKKASNFGGIANNLKDASNVGNFIIDILNEILDKNNINFNNKEKDGFGEYIKPTINEYVSKFLKETI